MKKKVILKASQFVAETEKRFDVKLQTSDVHLRRLEFPRRRKDNGYVCFFAELDGNIYYLKAFCGRTRRQVKRIESKKVRFSRPEYVAPCCFIVNGDNCAYRRQGDDLVLFPEFDVLSLCQKPKPAAAAV